MRTPDPVPSEVGEAKLITPYPHTTPYGSQIFSQYHLKRVGGGTFGLKTPRQSSEAIVPKFRTANLAEANLHGADLKQANLTGADLKQANLRDADLSEADLRRADLREGQPQRGQFRVGGPQVGNARRGEPYAYAPPLGKPR